MGRPCHSAVVYGHKQGSRLHIIQADTLAYQGMGIFKSGEDANLATQLWIAARFMEAISVLFSTRYLTRSIKPGKTLAIYLGISTLILLSIFQWHNFPVCYGNSGLTPFKIFSEYIISGLFITGIVFIIINRERFQHGVYAKIIIAYSASIAAELIFTTYLDVHGILNLGGHYLKLISIIYIYEGLVMTNLLLPYQQLQLLNQRLSQEISHRKNAEAKRLRYEQELHKLSKLESIATLAGGLAHDYKNLLTIILGNASLAELQTKDERVRQNLKNIAAAARQGAELANSMLSFSKDGQPKKEITDLKELVQNATQLALSGAKVKATFSFPEVPLLAAVDTTQLCQVINNLVINAVQAMPWGGFLQVKLHQEMVADPQSENLPIAPGEYIVATFKDQGVGISQEDLEQIFLPFFTTKEKGNGIGLATCFSIIQKHGGYITVSSQRGWGSTFTVYLPAHDPATAALQEVAATQE